MKRFALALSILTLFFAYGCSKTYYSAMESMGYDKREILSDRVENARESQKEAKEEFASALEQFKSVADFDGGQLQEVYEKLNDEYEDCKDQADDVKARIDSVEDVADALFDEWSGEIKQYSSAKLRRASQQKLTATKKKYNGLIRAMRNAENKMQPVLNAFHDQVLYLKHNLNAKAIASLQGELTSIRTDVDALIKEMDKSIAEADSFIKTLE
jgi:chromosome segregation ATPase